jgi:hypothetical protein
LVEFIVDGRRRGRGKGDLRWVVVRWGHRLSHGRQAGDGRGWRGDVTAGRRRSGRVVGAKEVADEGGRTLGRRSRVEEGSRVQEGGHRVH